MLKPKKSLSQNFLIDQNICRKILNFTSIKNKIVLEIGPGYGSLTDFILKKTPKKLFLIEKDLNLISHLKKKYMSKSNITIIEKDILKFDLNNFSNLIVISNLPYNISTKIILYLFKYNKNILEMILMVQKEVAQKFDYNLHKMNKYKFYTRLVSDYNICFDVSSQVFIPKPKVRSSIVKFKFNKKLESLEKAEYFSKLIFRNVRKKISNNIRIKKNHHLSNKRINELSIKELLTIYDLF